MAFEKITEEDLSGIGVIGLPDTPGLSTEEMQEKFEETARKVIIPKFNEAMDELPEVRPGALSSFPRPGVPGKIYVDTTAIPALMYVWDTDLEDFVPAGGTGGGSGSGGYDMTVSVPASGWTGEGPYTQEVVVSGMTANMAVVLAQVSSGPVATDEEKFYFSLITGYAQAEDSITFYASQKPGTDLLIRIFSSGSGESTSDESMISEEFDEKEDYTVGRLAIFKNKLWKFKSPKGEGPWDPSVVEETTVAKELEGVRSLFTIVDTSKQNSQSIEREFSIQIPVNVPEGYEICGVLSWSIENRNVINVTRVGFDASNVIILGYCTTQYNVNPYATVLCRRIGT